MVAEFEIPEGSKLYFGKSAKVKRYIENTASSILEKEGFEEILTPVFSYHQHKSIADEKELIRVNDEQNNSVSLRADSTIDVVRLIQKRLGRNTDQKKWFYIQPVFTFPTNETYQVGVEHIGSADLTSLLSICLEIFKSLNLSPLLQLSNIQIPKIISEMFDELSLDDFRHINIDKILSLDVEWLTKLVYLHTKDELDEVIDVVPDELKKELLKIKETASKTEYDKFVIAPLYYAKMLYYEDIYFRVIENNNIYARGGVYLSEDQTSSGFAVYVDELIEKVIKEETV